MSGLLDALRRDYEVVVQRLTFGDVSLDFCRVAEPDAVVDEEVLAASHEELAWQPYWAQAWETAYALAEELATCELSGCRVLDLGCGLGLTGSVAAARGAAVVMGDHAPPALRFARCNSWPWRDRVQVLQLDWRTDRLPERFDLIVGSDILYDRDDLPFLDAFWRDHLQPHGRILLGEPSRALTREFLAWIRARPWRISETLRRIPQSDRPIRLIELRPLPTPTTGVRS